MRTGSEKHNSQACVSLICNQDQLDAGFFQLYGIGADDADYILENFPIVKRHDEEDLGKYRTKSVILERYESMQALFHMA